MKRFGYLYSVVSHGLQYLIEFGASGERLLFPFFLFGLGSCISMFIYVLNRASRVLE